MPNAMMWCNRDQKASTDAVTLVVDDYKDRLHNWDILLKNVKAYYQVND